ncbi:baculoviral IAP repeat-containing protein 5.2-B-like isoform X2 [Nilaparvata lugens]|uniref:baculoviral IAP repeat-containing protein 5.2-B-like isoform X2 n=1 Tax=Nilaparvata lugens TaxID=108931 RepID=UPI00193CAC8C|nr:baculoviral IAP repeat-containing protein 5.2-B-like isoform X2 [Nilaparvata lugens]
MMELFNRPDDIMFWTKTRLQTFKYWPFDDKVQCNAKRMAAAGFYATGGREEPDLACCFVCKKSLNGWEETDDPWEEHKKHCPTCPFVKFDKKEKDLTIENVIDLLQHLELQRMTSIMKKKVDELHKLANAL